MIHKQQQILKNFPLYAENVSQQRQDFHLKFYSDHDIRDLKCQNQLH